MIFEKTSFSKLTHKKKIYNQALNQYSVSESFRNSTQVEITKVAATIVAIKGYSSTKAQHQGFMNDNDCFCLHRAAKLIIKVVKNKGGC